MHVLRITIGAALALALSGLSIACCFLFGTHLAPGAEGTIYGALGGVADALKALLPLGIAAALSTGQNGRAVIGIVLFTVFSVYSFASELGLYALSRDAQSSTASAGRKGYDEAVAERDRVQERLKALGQTRPAKTVKAELAGQFQSAFWQSSNQCQDATVIASRTFCAGVAKLQGELAAAEEAETLRAKEDTLTTKINGFNLGEVLKSADPQSEALARLTGWQASSIKDGLAILVALLIELGSGFGLYAASASGTSAGGTTQAKQDCPADVPGRDQAPALPQRRVVAACSNRPARVTELLPASESAADPVRAFAGAMLTKRIGREIAAADLYAAFARWCETSGHEALSPAGFGRKLTALKYQRTKRGGSIYYANIAVV